MAHVLAKDLRISVIKAAINGILTERKETETPVYKTLNEITNIVNLLVKSKTIKKEKILPIDKDDLLDIPDEWETIRLGSVIKLLSGQDLTSDRYSDKKIGIPYLTGASNFDNGRLIINRYTNSPTSVAKKGDLLITCKGTIGEMAFLNIEDAHIARQIMSISPLGETNINYIKLWLSYLVDSLNSKAKSIIPGIDRNTILNCVISYPPIEEQARIVAKVDELMAKIDEYEKMEKELAELKEKFPGEMRDAILQAAFKGNIADSLLTDSNIKIKRDSINPEYDTFDLPESWQYNTFSSVCDINTGLTFNKQDQCTQKETSIRVLRGGNINDNFSYSLYDNDVHVTYRDKYINLKVDDVITPAVTSMEKMCKVAYIDKCLKNTTAGGFVYMLRTKDRNILNPKFLMYYFNSPLNRANCKVNIHKSGQAFYNLKKSGLINQPIPLPSIEEQQRIVDKLDKLLPMCDELVNLC